MNPLDRRQPSARYVWYAIGLLAVANVLNYMDRMALAVLAPYVKADLDLSDTHLGLLIGLAFALFYATCAIPIARWADRGNRRNIIGLALAAWSFMTILSGAAQNFWHLFLARMGVGAGEAGGLAPAQSLICDYVPLKKRSGAFAVHSFGVSVGILIGMVFAGWLGERIGWRWTMVVFGVPGILLALIVRLTLREPRRGNLDAVKDLDVPSFKQTLWFMRRCRTVRSLALYLVAANFMQFGLHQWWPSFYKRVFALDLSTIGLYLGLAYGVGAALGVLLGGYVANKVAARALNAPLTISSKVLLFIPFAALGALFAPSFVLAMSFVLVTGLLLNAPNGAIIAAMYSAVPAPMRATAGALATFVISLFGIGLGPLAVGMLSDLLMPTFGSESLRYALIGPICVIPAMVIALRGAAGAVYMDLDAIGVKIERPGEVVGSTDPVIAKG